MDNILTKKDIAESLITSSGSELDEGKLPDISELEHYPSIYKMVRPEHLQSYLDNGFQRNLAGDNGTMYGEGVYASLKMDGSDGATRLTSYGSVLLEGKVVGGFERFIMFPEDDYIRQLIKKYYGSPDVSPEQQYYKWTNNWGEAKYLANIGHSIYCTRRNWRTNEDEFHYPDAVKLLNKYKIRGIIYRYCSGPTVLPFDFSSVVLFGYATGVYYDSTYADIKKRMKYVYKDEKFRKNIEKKQHDWTFQLNGRYESFDKQSAVTVRTNGELYCVVKNRGKFNIVHIDTDFSSVSKRPKEISQIWFDERPTTPLIENGIFQFTVNGITWYGTVFFPPEKAPAIWYPDNIEDFDNPDINNTDCWYEMNYETLNAMADAYRQATGKYVSESLTKTFRKYLNEEIKQNNAGDFLHRNWVRVYAATDKENIKSIFQIGQQRQFALGGGGGDAWYGIGAYTKLDTSLNYGRYGGGAIEYVVNGNFYGFLIFNEDWARKTYKDKWSLEDQCKILFPRGVAENTYRDIINLAHGSDIMHGVSTAALHGMYKEDGAGRAWDRSTGKRRTEDGPIAARWSNLFSQYGVKGAVYYGGNDGLCAVVWQYDCLIPYRYTLDGGNTWRDDLFNFGHAKRVAERFCDPFSKYRYKYFKVDDKVITCKIMGKTFYCTQVMTGPHRFNLIYSRTGEKIFPVDFTEEPVISLDGIVNFMFKGQEFKGIINHPSENVPAFWFPDDTNLRFSPNPETIDGWYGFEDLTNAVNYLNGNDGGIEQENNYVEEPYENGQEENI